MPRTTAFAAALCLGTLLSASAATAQQSDWQTGQGSPAMQRDRPVAGQAIEPRRLPDDVPGRQTVQAQRFVERAAQGHLAQIALAEMALDRNLSRPILSYAERIAEDHEMAYDDLERVADDLDLTIPDDPSPTQVATAEEFEDIDDPAVFQQAYIDLMVAEHRRVVGLFDSYARAGRDVQLEEAEEGTGNPLANYARTYLPIVQQHLFEAQDLQAGLVARAERPR